MNWKNVLILVAGGVLLFAVCFWQIPVDEKSEVLTDCVKSVAGVFRINFWVGCSIVLGMLCLFFVYLLRNQRRGYDKIIKVLEDRLEELKKEKMP